MNNPDEDPTVPAATPGAETPLPRTVGRYEIEGVLGRGGMGVVLRAYDGELRRHVALKLVGRSLLQDREIVARFVAEAQVTAQLQHPAIVPVYEVGQTADGESFYTMRLVRGRTLAQILDERSHPRFRLFRVLQEFLQVCRAVAYAHERGVVHRDLKPSNIMLGRFDEVHVMDWGLAKLVGGPPRPSGTGRVSVEEPAIAPTGPGITAVGSVMGSPGYMAPEQGLGDPDGVGPPADVYSLGAILYTIVVGRPPDTGTMTEVLLRMAQGQEPPRPRALDENVPRELDEACGRSLARSPGARPTAPELAALVERYLEGRPDAGAGRPEDAEFLKTYSAAEFRRPSVTADVVVVAKGPPRQVLLVRRNRPPFEGCWGLPGTFVEIEEAAETTAQRALVREAGLATGVLLEQLGAFGDPGRDPRTRVISIAFLAVLDRALAAQAEGARWFPAESLLDPAKAPAFAFDHAKIVRAALGRIGARA